jgi:hypothetical protein
MKPPAMYVSALKAPTTQDQQRRLLRSMAAACGHVRCEALPLASLRA